MIKLNNVTYSISGNKIFEDVSAFIPAGKKIGIVGLNGSGKSTLFKLILKEVEPEIGTIRLIKKQSIGCIEQHTIFDSETVINAVLNFDTKRKFLLEDELKQTDPDRISEIQQKLIDIDSYSAEARAARILTGLGFPQSTQKLPCSSFSGGWRMRLALAGILFMQPDLLLLDEPSNFLDLEGTTWLETVLHNYPNTVLVISHDRHLLNRSVNSILHISNKKMKMYTGTYDAFIKRHLEEKKQGQANLKKMNSKKLHMQKFVDRFKAKASKAKQAQSRIKAIEKLNAVPELLDSNVSDFLFVDPVKLSPPLITMQNVAIGYDNKIILKNINMRIDPKDKIAVVGGNGQGKSTFSKLLAEQLSPIDGTLIKARQLKVGYFSQDEVEQLNMSESSFQHISKALPNASPQKVLANLVAAGIPSQNVHTEINNLSGGQKTRLGLLSSTIHKPELLILDEPTNHLDIESREKLAKALIFYSGAVVLVSHDSYLINLVSESLFLVNNKKIEKYDGDLKDYQESIMNRNREEKLTVKLKKTQKKVFANLELSRKQALQIKKAYKKAEERVEKLSEMLKRLHNQLADPNLYSKDQKDRLNKLKQKDIELKKAISLAESLWLKAAKKYENL